MGADYELLPRAAGRIHRRQPGHHRLHSRTVRTRRHGGREGTPERPHLAGRLLRRPGVGADPPRRPPQFGTLPLIIGTLLVSLVAILIALPLGLGVAIYLSELAGERMREHPEAGHRAAGRHSVGRVRLLRTGGAGAADPEGLPAAGGRDGAWPEVSCWPSWRCRPSSRWPRTPCATRPRAMREASLALGASRWQTI